MTVRLVKEQPDVLVLYEGETPRGCIILERYGMDKSGATLRWMDDDGQTHAVHYVGATEESIARANPQHFLNRVRNGGKPCPTR